MNGPLVVGALFISLFPAVFLTVAVMFVLNFLVSIPLARARKNILQQSKETFLTEEMIERELARLYPQLYNVKAYSGFIMVGTLVLIYLVSFIVILVLGA